jgi:predicted  nucleic acid-binding Zn-ribbon protein
MPHQCLKCGKIFPEGTSKILQGCPQCGGTKFFYTQKPLNEKKRVQKRRETEEDTQALVKKVLQAGIPLEKTGDTDNWIHLKTRKVTDILEDITHKKDEITQKTTQRTERIESISVKDIGDYEINIQKLLQEESVIIQKNGSYRIHLPSVFKEYRKKK